MWPESREELENLKDFRHDLEEREPLEKRNISRNWITSGSIYNSPSLRECRTT
jgi:hypothetical protein